MGVFFRRAYVLFTLSVNLSAFTMEGQRFYCLPNVFYRADLSQRIPSHQPDQLTEPFTFIFLLVFTYYITPVQSNWSLKKPCQLYQLPVEIV